MLPEGNFGKRELVRTRTADSVNGVTRFARDRLARLPSVRSPTSSRNERSASADPVVFDPEALKQLRIVDVAAVENDRGLESLLDHVEIRAAELAPLRDDHERVCSLERVLGFRAQHEILAFPVEPPSFGIATGS